MSGFFRGRTPPRTLSSAEVLRLLKVTDEHRSGVRDHMIYSMALGTGLRGVEVVALNVGDVVHEGKIRTRIELRIYKGSRKSTKAPPAAAPRPKPISQVVWMPKALRLKLAKFITWKRKQHEPIAPSSPLFVTRGGSAYADAGERISRRTLRHHFHQWQIRAGFETIHGFHVLRHTALTNLYERTKDLRLVQGQARHASASTTEIYTHVSDDQMQRAVDGILC